MKHLRRHCQGAAGVALAVAGAVVSPSESDSESDSVATRPGGRDAGSRGQRVRIQGGGARKAGEVSGRYQWLQLLHRHLELLSAPPLSAFVI